MTKTPSDPVERERIGNHCEAEDQHTRSRARRDRAEERIRTAQQNGQRREAPRAASARTAPGIQPVHRYGQASAPRSALTPDRKPPSHKKRRSAQAPRFRAARLQNGEIRMQTTQKSPSVQKPLPSPDAEGEERSSGSSSIDGQELARDNREGGRLQSAILRSGSNRLCTRWASYASGQRHHERS